MNKYQPLFMLMLAPLLAALNFSQAYGQVADVFKQLDAYNVTWDTPGPTSSQSMPIGNGDIGLNVWVEPNGDLLFYIAKTDAWGAADVKEKNNWIKDGGVLMKLGKVRVSLTPSQLTSGAAFQQILKLKTGEILVKEGTTELKVWVDANNPVIRVETKSVKPVSVKVTLDNWRLGKGDTLLTKQPQNIAWYHRNPKTELSALNDITFGATISGTGLVNRNDTTLQSAKPVTQQVVSIYPLTAKTATAREFFTKIDNQRMSRKHFLAADRAAHQKWWSNFWQRSWVFINGDKDAENTTQGYLLQRFITACAGRGAYPIKFNGSIFVVDNPKYQSNPNEPAHAINADYREWGGQYWFQNTRAMYWPRLSAGDFDEMLPLFKMYADILPGNKALVKKYYNHGGAYFGETAPFWGGLPYMGPEVPENWTGHYFTPILELSMMMLDYYEHTGDKKFARETLLPVASAGLQFFDEHFKRDAQGKLLLDSVNSIEMFWKAHNPAPDIAGLRAVTLRMISLTEGVADAASISRWKRLYSELPPLPIGEKKDKQVLLPYTGPQTVKGHNFENPELYAIYPFRIYGLGKPDLQLAKNSFDARQFKDKGCWHQDPIQAAMLGYADVAKDYVQFALTRKQPNLKFPAFWATGHDYAPDEDNGGNGEHGLQQMLMQTDGKKILLLPAWPKGWNADFKLNAPYQTTVQGKVKDGKLVDLIVIPASRKADVVDMSAQR